MEAASRVIEVRGIAAMTLEDVRAEARVSSSQIYHYFTDRESLILAVLDCNGVGIADRHNPMAPDFTSIDAVRAWGQELIDRQQILEYANTCPLLAMSAAEGPERLHERAVAGRGQLEKDIRDGYRTMQHKGQLAATADPDRLATVTLATLLGGVLLSQLSREPGPLASAIDAVLSCLTEAEAHPRNMLHSNNFGFDNPKKIF